MKISVVIPVYNGHRYLSDAVNSALNQTYPDIEIIVVNDGSTDDGKARSIAKSFGSRIRYIEQDNKGVGGALNTGLPAMTGDVFCWLSHDDIFRPEKTKRQVDFFTRLGRTDVVLFSNYALMDETGRVTSTVAMERVIGDKPQLALLRGCINGCTIFVPKYIVDSVGLFDESLRFTQDYDMWKRISTRYSFVLMTDVLVNYRLHSAQGTKSSAATAEANKLWIDLIDSTPLADRIAIASSSRRFFQSQARFLASTSYDLAATHAARRAEQCVKATNVSVVIPFYNEVTMTKRAILSALAQTHGNLEVIAVDDGSTEAAEELDAVAEKESRLRIVHKTNGGPASARNVGMRLARGEYIAFLDCDDTWAPNKLETQISFMQEAGSLFSHTSYSLVHPNRKLGPVTRHVGKVNGIVYPAIIGQCPIHTSTVMIHRQLFDEGYRFPEAFRIGEDCLLWIDIARNLLILGIDQPMTTVEWSDSTAAISLSRSIEGIQNILHGVQASKRHRENAFYIAMLTATLGHLEKRKAGQAHEKADTDLNAKLLRRTFEGGSIAEIDWNTARERAEAFCWQLTLRIHVAALCAKRHVVTKIKLLRALWTHVQ
jgi:glycosyltransferase involved in cell wall biosynthesis